MITHCVIFLRAITHEPKRVLVLWIFSYSQVFHANCFLIELYAPFEVSDTKHDLAKRLFGAGSFNQLKAISSWVFHESNCSLPTFDRTSFSGYLAKNVSYKVITKYQ